MYINQLNADDVMHSTPSLVYISFLRTRYSRKYIYLLMTLLKQTMDDEFS